MTFLDELLPMLLDGVALGADAENVSRHKALVADVAESPQLDDVLAVVGYAHDVPGEAERGSACIAEAAARISEDWEVAAGGKLSRRMAAAVVAFWLDEYTDERGVCAALATAAAASIGLHSPAPELSDLASKALGRLADEARSVELRAVDLKDVFDRAVKDNTLPAENGNAVTSSVVRALGVNLRSAIRTVATEVTRTVEDLNAHGRRVSEETEMLWWMLAPATDLLPGPWEETGSSAPLAAALELARRTRLRPPARGLAGVLHEGLRKAGVQTDQRVTLSEFVTSAPQVLLEQPEIVTVSPNWAWPVLTALRKRAEGSPLPEYASFASPITTWSLAVIREQSLRGLVGR